MRVGPRLGVALGVIALCVLGFSFVAAALLSFRFSNPLVALISRFAALWLGFLNYFFWAACLSWLAWFTFIFTLLVAPV